VRDGAMWMHLDNVTVKVPPTLVKRSQVLLDALSMTDPSVTRKVTVPAPKEWLQAWAVCYCNEEESMSCKDIKCLVSCLLVCFLCLKRSSSRADKHFCRVCCIHSLSSGSTILLCPITLGLFCFLNRT
jgi:hypothetical protein